MKGLNQALNNTKVNIENLGGKISEFGTYHTQKGLAAMWAFSYIICLPIA